MECAHDKCTCPVDGPDEFCSHECRGADLTAAFCACGHPQCAAANPDVPLT
jgi:hypothetical protein